MTAPQILAAKVAVPSELRTKEWGLTSVWVRERAFFMAAVDRAETLDSFQRATMSMAKGELGLTEARTQIREELARRGYTPQPGQAGTIKDLREMRRMNVALETNLAQARGFARHERSQKTLRIFPAQRLVRQRAAKVEREDWPERFAAAVASTYFDGANVEALAALINHPCWTLLSRFGTPYPPFDFGSGMGLERLSSEESAELGILPGDDADPEFAEMMQPQSRGLNESLESRPAVREERLRQALGEELGGLAEWRDDRLVFTDPNGTRPYSAEDLAEVWRQPLPEAFEDLPGGGQMQREAFTEWVRDHQAFEDAGDRDKWEDLQRMHRRLENSTEPPPTLYRGMTMPQEALDTFIRGVQTQGYAPREKFPVESWTSSAGAASRFADTGTGRGWSVIVEMAAPDGAAFKDVSPLVRATVDRIGKGGQPPVQTESEWMLGLGRTFRARRIRRDQASRSVIVELGAAR